MVKACRKAAKTLIRDFGEIENLQVSIKGPGDFVTASDKKVEKILIDELQKARPNYSILSEEIGKINNRKAKKLYQFIDDSNFYENNINKENRSIMNIPFLLGNDDLDNKFLSESKNAGLLALKGHRSVGGMRASIYNGLPEEAVDALIEFMDVFQKEYS